MIPLDFANSLLRWSAPLMERDPDFTLQDFGKPYLLRWELPGSRPGHHVYLHRIVASEPPEAMHAHAWPNVSIVLSGRYIEHTPSRAFIYSTGNVVFREPADRHRLELNPGEICTTLFLTGDKAQAWAEGRYAEIGDFAR